MSVTAFPNAVLDEPARLHGKKFDVVLLESDRVGNEKSCLVTGTGCWRQGRFSIYRGAKLPELAIPDEALGGLIPVPRSLRSLLEGADYMIKLRVSSGATFDSAADQSGKFSHGTALAL